MLLYNSVHQSETKLIRFWPPNLKRSFMKNLLTQTLVSGAKEKFAQGVESFFMSIPVFGGLIVKEGNTYKKVPVPVTEQRDSSERWLTDIWRAYFLQKDSNGRYRGYKSIVANEGNIIFIPTKSFDDCFGNTIEAWKPLQANGNTLLVAITNILNANVNIPRDYSINDFIPEFDEELNFKIIFVNSRDEYEMVYETIDNSAAGKSKSDNYTSVLGGLGLLNVTTGETDLVEWTTSDMDRPLGLIDNNSIPKKVPEMTKIFKLYQDVVENVDEKTFEIVKYSDAWNAVFRAFCLDMTSIYMKGKAFHYDSFLTSIVREIRSISDMNTEEYWQMKLYKGGRGSSRVISQIKDFSSWIRHKNASVFKLKMTAIEWVVWELFSIDSSSTHGVRDVRENSIYVKGGSDILGGKDRSMHMYKLLNFLRLVFIYGTQKGFNTPVDLTGLFNWATDDLHIHLDYITDEGLLEKLGSTSKKGRPTAPRIPLKKYIYS